MMKRIWILFFFALLAASGANAQAMSDDEVMSYVQNAASEGKS